MGSTPIARSKPRKHCRRCTGFVSQAGPFNSGTRLQSVYLNRKRTSLVRMRTRFEAGRRLHALQALLVMHRPCKSDKSVRFGREAPPRPSTAGVLTPDERAMVVRLNRPGPSLMRAALVCSGVS